MEPFIITINPHSTFATGTVEVIEALWVSSIEGDKAYD